MEDIKQYRDYISAKREYHKEQTEENKRNMLNALDEYGKYIYNQRRKLEKSCMFDEEKNILRRYFGGN